MSSPQSCIAEKKIALPNDPDYNQYQKPYLMAIDYESAYKAGVTGEGVTVAIIDSGIIAHEDLEESLILQGYDATGSDNNDTTDYTGHGTFIAGVIGGTTNNNTGIVGLTPKVNILPIRCFDQALTTDVDTIVKAIYLAIESKVDVMNLSFTTKEDSPELRDAIDKALAENIIIVAPSGNDNTGELLFPAAYDGVVSVNSVNINPVGLKVSPGIKSNANTGVIVSAPGDNILSLSYTGGYKRRSGTSYATAIVSSVAVMAKQYDENLGGEEFIQLLIETSKDYGDEGYDSVYGYGLVNMKNIVEKLAFNKKTKDFNIEKVYSF